MTTKEKYLKVQEVLKQKGKTQKELAKFLNIREDSLSTALKTESIDIKKLARISIFLDVPISALIEDEDIFTCPNCGAVYEIKKK